MKFGSITLVFSLLAVPMVTLAVDIPAGGFAGTWKCNLAKSKFAGPTPQSEVFTVDPDSRFSITVISADGKTSTWSYKPQAGQAVQVEGRGPNVTVILRKVNAHRTEQTWNMDGRPAKSFTILSKDGKTQTFHIDGTGKDNKPFEEDVVYEKQ
jgi:hypothetical protein